MTEIYNEQGEKIPFSEVETWNYRRRWLGFIPMWIAKPLRLAKKQWVIRFDFPPESSKIIWARYEYNADDN